MITVLSFVVVVDAVPNKGKALVAENGAVDVASGGIEKVLSLLIPIVGIDSLAIVD